MQEKIRLLFIEDVAADAEIVARELSKHAVTFSFEVVDNEASLRRALLEKRADIVLSDYTLPNFDGMRALQVTHDMSPDTPFIFVSGTIGEERAIDALRQGATDYVLKDNLIRLAPAVKRALHDAAAKLSKRNTEQMLRDIVETSQDWIWQLDHEGYFTFSSPAVTAILGYTPEDLLGQHFDRYLHDEDATRADRLLPSAGNGKATLTGVLARWRHMNGEYRWLERNAIALTDAHGRPAGFRGMDRDVTLRRDQQERIQRLSRSYRMLSSISSGLLRARNQHDLLQESCRIAVEQGGYERAMITQIDSGSQAIRPVAWAGIRSHFLEQTAIPLDAAPDNRDLHVQAIRTGASILRDDMLATEPDTPFKREMVTLKFRTCVVLPLVLDTVAFGTLMLNARDTALLNSSELRVLQELAANIGHSLQHFRDAH